jgi:hypothetical protein
MEVPIRSLHTCSVYSGPPLIRPPLNHSKSGLIRGVAFGETTTVHYLKCVPYRGVASLESGLIRGGPLHCVLPAVIGF